MHYRYIPYPYYRRYYNLNPYYYGRYYNPYYNYQQNIVDSQISDIDQSIINYGDMTDVIQDADVYQSMTPAPEPKEQLPRIAVPKNVTVRAEPTEISQEHQSGITIH
jgi:ABC-type antimicrobial peptide transport system permease subunit